MEAEDDQATETGAAETAAARSVAADRGADTAVDEPAARSEPRTDAGFEPGPEADPDPDPAPDPDADPDSDAESEPVRRGPPVATGIGCAALLLPLVAVAGAILCFAAGILSAAGGCAPNGSALCSANGPWFAFALPLFVSPLVAAATAIGAVTVRRHRSTWLAVGYAIVFISVVVGLASASTGSG